MAELVQNPKTYIETLNVFHTSQGIIVSASIRSRSRPNLVHYTRIVLHQKNYKIIRASCDCEGFTFRKRCWHIEALKRLVESELKNREEKETDFEW